MHLISELNAFLTRMIKDISFLANCALAIGSAIAAVRLIAFQALLRFIVPVESMLTTVALVFKAIVA